MPSLVRDTEPVMVPGEGPAEADERAHGIWRPEGYGVMALDLQGRAENHHAGTLGGPDHARDGIKRAYAQPLAHFA